MRNVAKRFIQSEDGNAVIDWIVLTAGVVTLGITIGVTITASSTAAATEINSAMETVDPRPANRPPTILLE